MLKSIKKILNSAFKIIPRPSVEEINPRPTPGPEVDPEILLPNEDPKK